MARCVVTSQSRDFTLHTFCNFLVPYFHKAPFVTSSSHDCTLPTLLCSPLLRRAMAKKASAAREQEAGSFPADAGVLRSQLARAEQSLSKERQEHAVTKCRAQALEHQCMSLGEPSPA